MQRRHAMERQSAKGSGLRRGDEQKRRLGRAGMSRLWPLKSRKKPPRAVYVGSHEDKLSRLAALHVNPDDDGRTREDVAYEKTEGDPPAAVTRGFMA